MKKPCAIRSRVRARGPSICIGCGCDDNHACGPDLFGDACHWLVRSKDLAVGVCSFCPSELARFQRGNESLSKKAFAAVRARKAKARSPTKCPM